ncbi:PD-(D/E)XK nuclease family protein [Maribellus sp. YY47]|uniref:PD-(D/E)XK nuclease family protein n=1 Tax=Maribellus sp. YY47 TaxID=2929486 RepID=UPI0020008EC5|nr:PD-(D/E)XK nuclease family protein [Maribellus sp. YY47]MCK3685130.1 PD-(D/E)XK nuclease family protein [Maribellus sp. YY47]
MERFLSQCAQYIYKKHSEELKEVCVVFPNRRSGVFFTAYLQKCIETPVIAPKVITVNEWMSTYSEWHTGDKLQLISLLYDVFCKHTKTTETFDEFYFWGEILLSDFNDIDRYLVNAKDLFTNISDLKEIESIFDYLTPEQKKALEHFWGSMAVADKKGFREKYITIWDKLYPVYAGFKTELQKHQLAFPGMIDRRVVELLKEGTLEFPFQKYYIVGLNALNKCEIEFFSHLQKQGKAAFLWDYDDAYLKDENNEAGFFMRENLRRFPAPEDFELNPELFNHRKNMKLVAVSSVYGQSQQIPNFLKETTNDYRPVFDNTAVVLADESLLFSALGAIPDEIGKVNITMGYPVRNSVVYGFLMLLVALLKNKRKGEKGFSAYHRYVTDILNHQLLCETEPAKAKAFVADLKLRNRITLELAEIDFSPLHKEIFALPKKTDEYSPYFLRVLGMFYQQFRKAENADSMLLELIYSIYQAIEKLGAVVKSTLENQQREISEAVYFRLFSQYLGQVSVSFEGEPLSGLQVMGILETRCLDFENLIILGLNENKWPRKFTAPSFIPFNIRLGFGLPGIDEQDAMYAYYFYRLVQRAKNVTATYSVVKEGINTGELSRYGYQLQYDTVHKPEMLNLDFAFANDPVEGIQMESSPEIAQRLLDKNTEDRPLSPSAINTYLNCRLKFYFRYVAGLPEPDEVKEEIDGVVFGNIFHDTMEALYAPFVGKVIDKPDLDRILADKVNLNNEITRQIAIHYLKLREPLKGPVKLEGTTLLIFENIKTYLRQLIKRDKEIAPFTIISLETKYKRTLQVQGRPVWVGGTIDRVDQLEGKYRVIDYKTGKVESLVLNDVNELFERDAKDPKKVILQALIYVWGLEGNGADKEVYPAIYGLHKIFEENFSPDITLKKEKAVVAFDELREEFEDQLQNLVAEIYSEQNVFYQTEHAEKCKYCPYNGICRRH